jgi:hypothetical protein
LSLIEETLVVAIVAVLLYLAVPAAKYLFNNIETPAGVRAMIGSALNSAKAIASREQRYVGIRFQHEYYKDDPQNSPLKTPQYMIFIIYDNEKTNLVDGFRAVEGIEPVKLPENIGVMDLVINKTTIIDDDAQITNDLDLCDTTSFSLIFSPSGRLVVADVQTRNRDGAGNQDTSKDDIFNTEGQVNKEVAMFVQDSEPAHNPANKMGLEPEPSRRSFIIYDRNVLRNLPVGKRYSMYLEDLKNKKMIYINPYTGTFINR